MVFSSQGVGAGSKLWPKLVCFSLQNFAQNAVYKKTKIVVTEMLAPLDFLKLAFYHGEGNGNPLQYSCLENPMDVGAW